MRAEKCLISLFALVLSQTPVMAAPTQARNVLLIVADDMNDAVGAYGNNFVKTPNIDKLTRMGTRFTNAHANYPMSNPSRTSFLSGVYPESTQVFGNNVNPRSHLGDNWVMMNEHFDDYGYFTARAGKVSFVTFNSEYRWDVTEPATNSPGFKIAFQGGTGRWIWQALNNPDEDLNDGRNVRFIAQQVEKHKDEPFFIAMGFVRPHTPWIAPKKYFDLYPLSAIKLPRELGEPANDRDDIPAAAITNATEWADLKTDDQRRQAIAAAYACHSFVDAGVGILMDTLTRLDLWKNTTVVFFSDHGYNYGEHGGTVAKGMLFEDTTRVPLVIVSPGKAVNKSSPHPVELIDLYPTLSELAGLPVPAGLEGLSLVPLLDNPVAAGWTRPTYTVVRRSTLNSPFESFGRSVRSWRYRYTEWDPLPWGGAAATELYDLQDDPGEYTNQAGNPAYRNVLISMQRKLDAAKNRALLR